MISKRQYESILKSEKNRQWQHWPSRYWRLALGGTVGIHGIKTGLKDSILIAPGENEPHIYNANNWTWGCISLRNQDVDELFPYIKLGTPVKIIC
jgi:hypothetical protein